MRPHRRSWTTRCTRSGCKIALVLACSPRRVRLQENYQADCGHHSQPLPACVTIEGCFEHENNLRHDQKFERWIDDSTVSRLQKCSRQVAGPTPADARSRSFTRVSAAVSRMPHRCSKRLGIATSPTCLMWGHRLTDFRYQSPIASPLPVKCRLGNLPLPFKKVPVTNAACRDLNLCRFCQRHQVRP